MVMFPARYSGLIRTNCIITADALSKVLPSLELSFPICKEAGGAMATSKLLAYEDSPGEYIGTWMLAPVSALHPTPLFLAHLLPLNLSLSLALSLVLDFLSLSILFISCLLSEG